MYLTTSKPACQRRAAASLLPHLSPLLRAPQPSAHPQQLWNEVEQGIDGCAPHDSTRHTVPPRFDKLYGVL